MPENTPDPTVHARLDQFQRQFDEITARLGRIERRLGLAALGQAATPTVSSQPTAPTAAGSTPAGAATPPPFAAPAFDLSSGESSPTSEPTIRPRRREAREGEGASPGAASGFRPETAGAAPDSGATGMGQSPVDGRQWEALIGGKWALWLGSVAVFFALAFFLASAWQYLGNAGRFTVGIIIGAVFVGAGAWTRERVESWFSEGLTGGGLAVLYLSLWAGAQSYHLLSFELAFTLMALTTAAGVGMAVRYNAVSLSALSTLGGFLTPVLLRSTGGAATPSSSLLAYLLLLNAGIQAVSLRKRWRGIIWLSFGATLLLMLGWAADSYNEAMRWTVFAFVTLYFLLFLGAACFYSLIHREETAQEDLLLLFAASIVYAVAGHALLLGALGHSPGAFSLAMALFFALLASATRAMAPENLTLGLSAQGLSLLFLTLTVPIQLRQGWIGVAYSLEAAVLVTLGLRLQARLLLTAGRIVWGLSLFSLLLVLLEAESSPHLLFLNRRALPLLVSVLASGWMALQSGVQRRITVDSASGDPKEGEEELSPLYAAYAVLAGAWLIAQETYLGFGWRAPGWGQDWQVKALFSISCFWSVYAVAVYAAGLRLRLPSVRFTAFTVLALAAVLPVWGGLELEPAHWAPFWNPRWLSYIVVVAALGTLLWLISHEKEQRAGPEIEAVGVLPLVISLVALCGMSIEIYASFGWRGSGAGDGWKIAASFALAALWGVFSLALLAVGLVWEQSSLRRLAFLIGGAGVALLLVASLNSAGLPWAPIASSRFLAFAVVTTSLAVALSLLRRHSDPLDPRERGVAGSASLLLLIVMLAVWGLTQETYETFRYYQSFFGDRWDRAAQMSVSLVWTLCGGILLIAGIVRGHQPIRLLALGLFGVTVLKVFLFDLSFLDRQFRVLSFGGLGLALIGISWLYTRYGVGREPSPSAEPS